MKDKLTDLQFLEGASLSYPRAVINIYHKGCLACENESNEAMRDDFAHFVAFAEARSAQLRWNLRRTELSPEYHRKASEILGTEFYPPVVELVMARGDSTGAVHMETTSMSFQTLCEQIRAGATLSDIFA